MLTVGDRFPVYRLKATTSRDLADGFAEIRQDSFPDKWTVYVFYPKDFTFVCPTELAGFGDLDGEFRARDTQVLACSTDSEFVHLAWRTHERMLHDLPLPLLSDIRKDLSRALGILDPQEEVCRRATFIVDPEGVIRFASVNDDSVGRNPDEVLRVLDALQTGGLTACGWRKGEATLSVA